MKTLRGRAEVWDPLLGGHTEDDSSPPPGFHSGDSLRVSSAMNASSCPLIYGETRLSAFSFPMTSQPIVSVLIQRL